MKVLAFGASYSRESINKQFAHFAARYFVHPTVEMELLDLNQFQLPIFTVDIEKEQGHPQAVHDFVAKLDSADLIIISMAEHNGSYTSAFKNLFDWASRVKGNTFENKKIFLLSTSTGGRGGAGVIAAARDRFPRHGAEIVGQFSLPFFDKNFNPQQGITDPALRSEFELIVQLVRSRFE